VSKTRNAYDLSINSSTLYAYINDNEVNTSIDETWRHVVLTYDGATLKLYVDGNLNASDSLAGAINTNNDVVNIGNIFLTRYALAIPQGMLVGLMHPLKTKMTPVTSLHLAVKKYQMLHQHKAVQVQAMVQQDKV